MHSNIVDKTSHVLYNTAAVKHHVTE